MSYRVDPEVAEEMKLFGGETASRCFNCGNCTAICSITDEATAFPRQYIRYIQLGLTDQMAQSPDPWMCYYCGDCSETCPREAEPGEMMMAARRWLTAKYDWTGIGRAMYKSEAMEFLFLGLAAIVVLLLFTIPENFGFKLLAANPEARAHVDLEAFAPEHFVHNGDLIMAGILGFFLLTNAFRMFLFGIKGVKIPFSALFTELPQIFIHLFTQKRWKDCETDSHRHWLRHFLLFTGYATMFILVVPLLLWFQEPNTQWNVSALFGYYATVTLMWASWGMIQDRLKKKDQIHKFSHLSDWMFPILLFLTAVTGAILHAFRLMDLAMPTYIIYLIHLMIAVPMLVIEVPFGKWAHLLYRPLSMYIAAIRKHAVTSESKETVMQQQ